MVPAGSASIAFVVLGTGATVIASQALISGVFSLVYQAIRIGYFPRVTVRHTSREAMGQIYVPVMNVFLGVSSITLVLLFGESSRLAAAFGLAVSGTMAVTSLAFYQGRAHSFWLAPGAGAGRRCRLPRRRPRLLQRQPAQVRRRWIHPDGRRRCLRCRDDHVGAWPSLLRAHYASRSEPVAGFLATLERRVDARPRASPS